MSGLKHPPIVLLLCLTRTLVDRLPPRVDERRPVMLEDSPPEFYHRTAAVILERLDTQVAVWVFAAGSLIWKLWRNVCKVAGFLTPATCLAEVKARFN